MDRRFIGLVGGLAALSSTVLVGSVVTALSSFEEQDVVYSAVAIPRGLLSPEPVNAVIHRPPTAQLSQEIGLAPAPMADSTTTQQKKPVVGGKTPPKQAVAPPPVTTQARFEISTVSSAKGRGGSRTLAYEIIIKNVGQVALPGLVLRSHVPAGTSWAPSPTCGGKGHEVTVGYPTGKERLCVAGDQVVPGDGAAHPVDISLNAFNPGTSVTVSYLVELTSGYAETIHNHAHLSGNGVELMSNSTSDSGAGSQSAGQ